MLGAMLSIMRKDVVLGFTTYCVWEKGVIFK